MQEKKYRELTLLRAVPVVSSCPVYPKSEPLGENMSVYRSCPELSLAAAPKLSTVPITCLLGQSER